jgi:hypothetical protein
MSMMVKGGYREETIQAKVFKRSIQVVSRDEKIEIHVKFVNGCGLRILQGKTGLQFKVFDVFSYGRENNKPIDKASLLNAYEISVENVTVDTDSGYLRGISTLSLEEQKKIFEDLQEQNREILGKIACFRDDEAPRLLSLRITPFLTAPLPNNKGSGLFEYFY